MSTENKAQDPMEFMRGMWSKMGFSLPGMVTPTLDVEELDKRITDMKAVENWLKMNLSSLQMATQALEMQRATIATMQAMSKIVSEGGKPPPVPEAPPEPNPFGNTLWPWNLMQNAAEQAKAQAQAAPAPNAPAKSKPKESK